MSLSVISLSSFDSVGLDFADLVPLSILQGFTRQQPVRIKA